MAEEWSLNRVSRPRTLSRSSYRLAATDRVVRKWLIVRVGRRKVGKSSSLALFFGARVALCRNTGWMASQPASRLVLGEYCVMQPATGEKCTNCTCCAAAVCMGNDANGLQRGKREKEFIKPRRWQRRDELISNFSNLTGELDGWEELARSERSERRISVSHFIEFDDGC